MGNASVKMSTDGQDVVSGGSDSSKISDRVFRASSPDGPKPSPAPFFVAAQVPTVPMQRPVEASPPVFNQVPMDSDIPVQKGIPTLITWNYAGNEVFVEGSWDNWTSRKALHKSGKDHSILLVLPFGVYHYKLTVDGEPRHIPDLPYIADESGRISNILNVNGIVPENTESVKEFEHPPSPIASYTQSFLEEEEFAKEPYALPSQLNATAALGPTESSDTGSPTRPQHVVLDHLFLEKGWASESLVALGMTHRFCEKYVSVVLYKPLKS